MSSSFVCLVSQIAVGPYTLLKRRVIKVYTTISFLRLKNFLYATLGPINSQEPRMSICTDMGVARRRRLPLHISFNSKGFWRSRTNTGASLLWKEKAKSNRISLQTILEEEDLETIDFDSNIR